MGTPHRWLVQAALIGAAAITLQGCAGQTTADLARETPASRWRFQTPLDKTAACLAGALNAEWQPKSKFEQTMGRSIGHQVVMVEPGKVSHVVHEHIGPGTGWMFVVTASGPGSEAAAHITLPDSGPKMDRAATTCGGQRTGQ